MGAGLSHRQKYDRVRRALMKLERWARNLKDAEGVPLCEEVFRKGGSHLFLHHRNGHSKVLVQFRWLHASNGECLAMLYLNGHRAWGCIRDRITEALQWPELVRRAGAP